MTSQEKGPLPLQQQSQMAGSPTASHMEFIIWMSLGFITKQNEPFGVALINETALLYGSGVKGTVFNTHRQKLPKWVSWDEGDG